VALASKGRGWGIQGVYGPGLRMVLENSGEEKKGIGLGIGDKTSNRFYVKPKGVRGVYSLIGGATRVSVRCFIIDLCWAHAKKGDIPAKAEKLCELTRKA